MSLFWGAVRPLMFRLDPERAHEVAMKVFAPVAGCEPVRRLSRRLMGPADPRLRVRVFGVDFPGPLGLAAGFDKDALWFNALDALGFGFIEVGTLTGQPQPGNPKPRLFRLPADRALINRFGFNNHGSEAAALRLGKQTIRTVLGINIGKSKVVPNDQAAADYLASFERLYPFAHYFVVNVSSPNTPGLRQLQERGPLTALLRALADRNAALARQHNAPPRPILLKIAPDLGDEQLDDIAALAGEIPVAGLVATNTTVRRDGLRTPAGEVQAMGDGGLSGAPLTLRSRRVVAGLYRRTGGRLPIIGVGGIMSGADAWEMIRAGASLVQSYTGFIYGGPGFARAVHRELSRRLTQRKLDSLAAVVGEGADEVLRAGG